MKQLACEYNIDTACVEVRCGKTLILAVDCIAVENEIPPQPVRTLRPGLPGLQRADGIRRAGPVRQNRGLPPQVHRLFRAGLNNRRPLYHREQGKTSCSLFCFIRSKRDSAIVRRYRGAYPYRIKSVIHPNEVLENILNRN